MMSEDANQQRPVVVEYLTPAQRKPVNPAAIVAMVSAMVCVGTLFVAPKATAAFRVLLAILIVTAGSALLFGIAGIWQARSREGSGRTRSWISIIFGGGMIGLVVGGIVMKGMADRAKCDHNSISVGTLLQLYASDHGGQYPSGLNVFVK